MVGAQRQVGSVEAAAAGGSQLYSCAAHLELAAPKSSVCVFLTAVLAYMAGKQSAGARKSFAADCHTAGAVDHSWLPPLVQSRPQHQVVVVSSRDEQ